MSSVDWEDLFNRAENEREPHFVGTVDITVAEELALGFHMNPMEVVVVEDAQGRIWALYETHGEEGGLPGLVSRYNVRLGMELRLQVSASGTKVFCITPELEGRNTRARRA